MTYFYVYVDMDGHVVNLQMKFPPFMCITFFFAWFILSCSLLDSLSPIDTYWKRSADFLIVFYYCIKC